MTSNAKSRPSLTGEPFLPVSNHEYEGIAWCYRLILLRDPTQIQVSFAKQFHDLRLLARVLVQTDSFDEYVGSHSARDVSLSKPAAHQAVKWAFRFFLNRTPSSDTCIGMAEGITTVKQLLRTLLFSEEFRLLQDNDFLPLVAVLLTDEFKILMPAPPQPQKGYFTDFIGTKTRCSFLPDHISTLSGQKLSPPGAVKNGPIHDIAEWTGTLRSVLEAENTYSLIEVGAGWAPWLAVGFHAAKMRGIDSVYLSGVEGCEHHCRFMRQHLEDNGVCSNELALLHGLACADDGFAFFPTLDSPREDYGAAVSNKQAESGAYVRLPSYSLHTLAEPHPQRIDLIHVDVQGTEFELLSAHAHLLNSRVRRVIIGTHSRLVEAQLLSLFSDHGWQLEHESSCLVRQNHNFDFGLLKDGCQVWRNVHV